MALRNVVITDSSLKGRKLADDERVLCASADYIARHGRPHQPSDLTNHHLIAFRDLSAKPLIGKDGRKSWFDPAAASCQLIVDDGNSQKLATIAGAGISINSVWSVHKELESGALQRVLTDYVLDEQTALWLVYPKSNVVTAKVRVFLDFLLDEVRPTLLSLRTNVNSAHV
jgi:DNA-binding transcriptional LysR family regulator